MNDSISPNARRRAARTSDLYLPTHGSTRGLRPFEDGGSPWPMRVGIALAALGMVAGGIVVLAMRRAERKRSLRGRIEGMLPW